jgi:hypothetical protein
MRLNIFNPDFQDFIRELNIADVNYMLVGGYSVILHGYSRTTGDLDVWIEPTKSNFQKMQVAFQRFGLPTNEISEADFLNTDEKGVYTFGRPPVSIDILTKVKGLDFQNAFARSEWFEIEENLNVRAIRLDDLISSKKSGESSA